MPPPTRLPDRLGPAFRVSEAMAAGVGPGRLRGADLARVFHGARAEGGADLLAAYAPLLRPGDRFSHTTAARAWGCPVGERPPIHVSCPRGVTAPQRRDVLGHQTRFGMTVERNGFPVSDPITAFIEVAAVSDLDTAVRVGDYLVLDPHVLDPHDIRPHVRLADLRAAVASRHDNGIVRARRAVSLVREGAESPTETDLRLLLERHGFHDPVLGFELFDDFGSRVGWFDLAWPDVRVFVEYDGDQHRTSKEQYEIDMRRFDRASDLGWRTVKVRRRGLYVTPDDTVLRVERAFAAARQGRF